MNHNSFFHCVSQIRRKTFLLLEAACLLIQTNLLSNHSITPLFCSDNGLYRGLLKSVTADLGGDTGQAISLDKPSTEQDDLKGAKALLFFNVPREQEAKLEVSPPRRQRSARGVTRKGSLLYRGGHLIQPEQRLQVIYHPLRQEDRV